MSGQEARPPIVAAYFMLNGNNMVSLRVTPGSISVASGRKVRSCNQSKFLPIAGPISYTHETNGPLHLVTASAFIVPVHERIKEVRQHLGATRYERNSGDVSFAGGRPARRARTYCSAA